jgi:guanine deaminase
VGIFGNSTLLDWLEKYTFPLEASLKDPAKARRVYARCIAKTLSHGTTTAAYYATVDVASTNLLADLCLKAGQRALVGRVCMDQLSPAWYRDESPASALSDTRETIKHITAIQAESKSDGAANGHKEDGPVTVAAKEVPLVRPVLTPRFAPSCSAELLRGLGKLAAETQLPIQTHIAENKGEVELVRKLYPPSVTGAPPDQEDSYAGVYDAFGLLTDKTILAHAIHLSEQEADLISQRKAKVAHCPCSNSAITSGAARVRWLLGKDIDVGLGTDMSGGYSPSVLEAARLAALVSRHVAMGGDASAKLTVEEVLWLATRGGARVVGLEDVVGGFEVGKAWDAQLIGLGEVDAEGEGTIKGEQIEEDGNVDVFGWETWDDRIAKWLFNGDDRNTRKVWVRGRLVHERK